MRRIDWRNPKWRKRAITVLTVILVFCLAAHPELRIMAPLVDALGIDGLIVLLSFQLVSFFSESIKPQLLLIHNRYARPLIGFAKRQAKSSRILSTTIDVAHSLLQLFDPAQWLFGSGFIGQFLFIYVAGSAPSGKNRP